MQSRRRSSRYEQKSPVKRFLFVLGLLFFLMYLVLGLMIVFWKQLPLSLPYNLRVLFGCAMIIYAFFRFVRLVQNNRNN